jgi:hypothetical protein
MNAVAASGLAMLISMAFVCGIVAYLIRDTVVEGNNV